MRGLPEALKCGTICAVAGQSQREMREWAEQYPGLYGADVFDPALFSTLSLAAAFSGPGLAVSDLRMANRVCLWCFGLDWLIDYAAGSGEELSGIVRRCAAVADGAPAGNGDELTHFLADIRDELAKAPAFPGMHAVWRDELQRMLDAMAREWAWKTQRGNGVMDRPDFEEYLDNADNLGFSFVFASHWIFTSDAPVDGGSAAQVRIVSHAVQRVIRLLNDFGSYERDLAWGDLNGLMLDLDRVTVANRVVEETARARKLAAELRAVPKLAAHADYMERQMDFCAGFYGVTDYWGVP